ncbi:MAG: DNA alkylation repair protein [Mariniphaga sp.]
MKVKNVIINLSDNLISDLRRDLNENSSEELRKSTQHFFKDEIRCYGIKSAATGLIGKAYLKTIKNKPKTEIFKLCEELWQSGLLEESIIACNWSYSISRDFQPSDIKVFEKWINNYVNNWASCDTFCNHTVGKFIEMYPAAISELKEWTQSKNRWMRRASAVSLIIPARKGKFTEDIFDIAGLLLMDSEDMVQKGYGWMLKVTSQSHQKEVFDFVLSKKMVMPRTALRYAIEKMPAELRLRAMQI